MRKLIRFLCVLLLAVAALPQARADRIKDIATIGGVRQNQLIGYGLVVGLDGTGDQTTQTPFTVQSLISMLTQLGVSLPSGTSLQLKNVAAVMVTAELPAFAHNGQTVDVTVSSLGNAKSLRGGTLLLTPLKGADGQVYAMAQGNLVVAGAGASAGGSSAQINSLAVGRVPQGGTVEREVRSSLGDGKVVTLDMNTTDFTTVAHVVAAINAAYGNIAQALDGRTVKVEAPTDPTQRVAFLAQLQDLSVTPGIGAAKVILNARTGSVVMNQVVTITPCAIAHGNLSVTVKSTPEVSQPNPLAGGNTVTTQQADISIKSEAGQLVALPGTTRLEDLVKALNAIGATPQDLLAILQAMQAAGALKAQLQVI